MYSDLRQGPATVGDGSSADIRNGTPQSCAQLGHGLAAPRRRDRACSVHEFASPRAVSHQLQGALGVDITADLFKKRRRLPDPFRDALCTELRRADWGAQELHAATQPPAEAGEVGRSNDRVIPRGVTTFPGTTRRHMSDVSCVKFSRKAWRLPRRRRCRRRRRFGGRPSWHVAKPWGKSGA